MSDIEEIANALVSTGTLSSQQLERAQAHAREADLRLDEALIGLSLVDYGLLGNALADATSLPYVALPEGGPPYEARKCLSYTFAERWQALPIAFDADSDVLTVAVSDAQQTQTIETTLKFLMRPHHLNFTIASEAEIHASFEKRFGTTHESASRKWLLKPVFARTSGPKRQEPTDEPTYSYSPMGRAVISVAACLVGKQLADQTGLLDEIRDRVRYCQVLAARAGLTVTGMDAVALAAWLSAFDEAESMVHQLDTPYALNEILSGSDGRAGEHATEADMLSLVRSYQQIRKEASGEHLDVAQTRQQLLQRWNAQGGRDFLLDTFLQILVDEEFLTKRADGRGRILIVDQSEVYEPHLSQPLRGDGYDVSTAASASLALNELEQRGADLILVSLELPDSDGIDFCRKVKQAKATADIPVLLTAARVDAKLTAQALRAGAEDILPRRPDLEILLLKISRFVKPPREAVDTSGVKGTLEDMSFTDLVQILGSGGKRMVIALTHADQVGFVWLDGGDIVGAEVDDQKDDEAFYRMMQWNEGEFAANQTDEFTGVHMRTPVMSLLMEGARRMDEGLI